MPNNSKTYTEVLIDIYDKLDNVEQRVIKRIDVIASDTAECREKMARGDVKFDILDKRIDKTDGRVDGHDDDLIDALKSQSNVGKLNALGTVLGTIIASVIGTQK